MTDEKSPCPCGKLIKGERDDPGEEILKLIWYALVTLAALRTFWDWMA
jgi:hypothetical protein